MPWIDLLPAFALATLFMVGIGLPSALAIGMRGFLAVAVSPMLSATAITLGAIAAGLVGIPWGWWVPVVSGPLLAAATWGVRVALRHCGLQMPSGSTRGDLRWWVSWALAAALMALQLKTILLRPDSFAQRFDNLFHLNAVRYAVVTQNGSSLTLGRLTDADASTAFYPAGFHDAASLVLQAFPASLPAAVNAVLVVICALIWPAACLAMSRLVLPGSWVIALATAVACTSFPAFPTKFLEFGVLYPNVYGLAMLPALLGLLIQFFRLSGIQIPVASAAITAAMAAPGVALAHPNAVMSGIALAAPIALAFAYRSLTLFRRRTLSLSALAVRLAIVAAYAAATPALWIRLRPSEEAAWWPPTTIPSGALGEALLNAPLGIRAAWFVSVLVVLGLLATRSFRRLWLAGAWLLAVGLWIVVAGWPKSELRTLLTGVWYNDPPRVAALLPLVAIPLVALGAHAFTLWVVASVRRVSGGRAPRRPVLIVATIAVAAGLTWGTQSAEYLQGHLTGSSTYYELTNESPMVTLDEYALIERVVHEVPQGAVVATDPWNGSSLLFALSGVRTTTTHVFYDNTPDLAMLQDHLDEAGRDPQVCDAVRRLEVTHVLDFGDQAFRHEPQPFPGFDSFATSPGFKLVDMSGPAALYEVTACR